MTESKGIKPKLTLSDLYAEDVVYSARPSYISNPWLEPEEHQSNFLTGRELLISNELPVIVHEACITEKLEHLFQLVDMPKPSYVLPFHNKESYESLLRELAHEQGKKIYFQYVHDDDILEDMYYALDKTTFIALNNKAKIPEWTAGQYLPKRAVVEIDKLKDELKQWDFPFVLKPGDDLPTAGGYGVIIVYNEQELADALERIEAAQEQTAHMIIEEKVEAVANYCVQYACKEGDAIQYLGSAQQLTNDYGFYNGNESVTEVPEAVIEAGRRIMEIGVSQGFHGVAGFDLLVDDKGEVYAIDLNFRQNGSTDMLLLEPLLTPGYHKFFSYVAKKDNAHFYETIVKYVEKGVLYPLSYYDGEWFTDEFVGSRFGCIWHGRSKEEIEHLETQFLKELGQV